MMAHGQMTYMTMTDLDQEEGQGQVPPPTPGLPYDSYYPVGCSVAPHRCPHCDDTPANAFPLPPYSETDPQTHYDDLFPPGYTPFPNTNTHLCPSFNALPPIPSISLNPPPPYDTLFATAVPPDTAVAPPSFPDYWNDPDSWDTDAGSD